VVVQVVRRGLATPDQLRQGAAERGRRVAALVDGALPCRSTHWWICAFVVAIGLRIAKGGHSFRDLWGVGK